MSVARKMTRLSVNLNKVALLRNQRDLGLPSVEAAARTVLEAGASGVTVHPRPDGRHALPEDVRLLCRVVEEYGAELNVEGNPTAQFMELITEVVPHQVTLVPDAPEARTSDHGWDLVDGMASLQEIVPQIQAFGARVSVFVDHETEVERALQAGVDAIELYTEPYAQAFLQDTKLAILKVYKQVAIRAAGAGLRIHAGHDLNLDNLGDFLTTVPHIAEVSIGHAFTAEALWRGLSETTLNYLRVIDRANLLHG